MIATIAATDEEIAVAVFEAVNAVTREYKPYLGTITAPAGASAEAAVVAAAHAVLRAYFPASAASLDAAPASSLAALPEGPAKASGIAVGEAAAAAMVALRANDGSALSEFYLPVSSVNTELLGEFTDLREFLFGGERAVLAAVRPVLVDLQAGRCFYCGDRMYPEKTEVDHFVPWSRYAAGLGHNFLLADSKCNNRKRDRIPAVEHLARWTERNARYDGQIAGALRDHLAVDLGCSVRVAHWAYAQTEAAGGLTWVRREVLEPLGAKWRGYLGA